MAPQAVIIVGGVVITVGVALALKEVGQRYEYF